LLVALVGGFAFVAPGSAWATTGHTYVDRFGGVGDGDGQFGSNLGNGPAGVAVMPSTGEVFTADNGQGVSGATPRVQRFDAAGVFQSRFALDPSYEGGVTGLAVDPTGFGAVYVATGENGGVPAVVKYSLAGVKAYALDVGVSGVSINAGARVAVDPVDGTVYVTATDTNTGAQVIASFDSATGGFLASFDGLSGSPDGFGFCSSPSSLAVDGSHQVYVLGDKSCFGLPNRVDRYGADGGHQAMVDDGSRGAPSAVAADPVSDEVYVSHPGPLGVRVTHFSAGGAAPIYTFDASQVGGVRGIAVSGTGTVYLSDSTRPFVARFTRFEGPTVVTGGAPPESVQARSAMLEGTIDPEGVDSSYHFEYGLDQRYGSRTAESDSVGSGSDPVAASTLVEGLKPNKTYHFRLVGSNASGSIVGGDQSFVTALAPPDVDGGPPGFASPAFASAIGPRSARLHGTVNTNTPEDSASYYLEYGTTTAYGDTTVAVGESGASCFTSFGSYPCDGDDRPVIGLAPGLEPGTTYHFRVVVGLGVSFPAVDPQVGADQTFTTAPAAGGGATGVTTKRATLTGTIDPHGEETSYYFNYGPTTSYGARTPEVAAGSGDGEQQVSSQPVSGLLADTTYHVQVVAKSDNGVTRYGADGLFRTPPVPTAVAISPIGVSTGSATLVGEVDTHGLPGSYRFDVSSLDSSYSSSTVERAVEGSDGVERVSVAVDGLPAGETFVVELRVASNDSVSVSDLVTFATASVPRVFPPPPADPYGCTTPRLDGYDGRPKPGDTITIGGRDLGAGGAATLGDRSIAATGWSPSGFKLEIPDDATGTLGLTVNCGKRSNTVAIAIFKRPTNRFSIADTTVKGSRATLSVRVPGPGKLTSSAAKAKPGKATVRRARGANLVVRLNRAGVRALRRSKTGRLKVPVEVRYLPAGGKSATKTVTVTFKHTAGR